MKFKERRGNVFVFDGGYDSEELEVRKIDVVWYEFRNILISNDLMIDLSLFSGVCHYNKIQTAVNLMTILKDEGLV